MKEIQGAFGGIGKWFGDRWHEVQGIFGGIGAWFHDRWVEAWNGTTAFFGGIGKWFGDRWHDVQGIFGGIGNWFHDRWQEAWNGVTAFFGKVGQWFSDRWNEIVTGTKPFRDYMGAVFHTIWDILVALWGKLGQWFHDRFTEAWNEIVKIWTPVGKWFGDRWTDVSKWFVGVGQWFHDRFFEAIGAIYLVFGGIGKWFGDRWHEVSAWFQGVGQWFHDRWQGAWNEIVKIWTPIGKWFGDRWVDVKNIWGGIGQWFHDRGQEAWNKITEIFGPIGKWFGDRWNEIKTNVSNKWNEIKTDTSDIFKGLINVIIDQLNNGIQAFASFINFFGQKLDDLHQSLVGTPGTIPMVKFAPIPHYATGTDDHPGGLAVLGEHGRELVSLPKGSKVAPNDITESLLAMLGGHKGLGKIPGYAAGIGDLGAQIAGWIAGGAKSVLDGLISLTHISAPSLPGMSDIATGMFNKVKEWALNFVSSIIPKFDFGTGGGTGQGTPVSIPGNLQSWIAQAMAITGVPGNWAGALAQIALHESGGNPNSVNNWDSNALAGHPSQGLFQMIPSTFAAHMISGHGNILNPVDSGISAIRYIQGRYGDVFHVPGIQSMAAGQAYVGYSQGGIINEEISGVGLKTGTRYSFGEGGKKELVVPYLPSGVNLAHSLPQGNAQSTHPSDTRPIYLQIDGRTFARLNLPYHVAEVRNQVGVRI
jgi:SLT domain-containing protein